MHSIRQIEIVQALARRRHFGLAAQDLGVSQPALTRSLKQLEADLGVLLFDRQGVTPTLFGEMILRHGARAVAEFRELSREMALAKGLEIGELTIVAAPYPAAISAKKALGVLIDRHPRLRIELRLMNWEIAARQVSEGAADLGMAELSQLQWSDNLELEPLRRSPLQFFCRRDHPLIWKPQVTKEDVFSYPWAGPSVPARIAQVMPKGEVACGYIDPEYDVFRCRVLVGSFESAKTAVLESHALSCCIPWQIEQEVRDGKLAILPLDAPWMSLNYGFMTKRGRTLSPAADAYMQIVRDIEGAIPE